MNRKIILVFAALLISGLTIFPGCKDDNPTFGTLTVVVQDFLTGLPVAGEQVYIATSYQNMQNKTFYRNAWTNDLGIVYFGELPPLVYFIDTQDWQDWVASQVYAGYDDYVVLFVNTPEDTK